MRRQSIRSRAVIAAFAVAVQFIIIYALIAFGFVQNGPANPTPPSFQVRLIKQTRHQIVSLPRFNVRPELANLQIALNPTLPALHVQQPEAVHSNTGPPMPSSPAPHEATAEHGTHVSLRFSRYVTPIEPPGSARLHRETIVTVVLTILPNGIVDNAYVLHSTSSPQLNRAVIAAVRRWRFVPFTHFRKRKVRRIVNIRFLPQNPRLRLPPYDITSYSVVARQLHSEMEKTRGQRKPHTIKALRELVHKLLVAFRHERHSREHTLTAEFGVLGPVQSIRFQGFIPHGMQNTRSGSSRRRHSARSERRRWEVYDVKQRRGSSVWLVKAASSGTIRRIEVAIRCTATACRRTS